MSTKSSAELTTPTKWLVSFLSPYKKQVAIAIIALGISSAAWLLLGQSIRFIVDSAFSDNPNNSASLAIYFVVGLLIVGSIATYFRFSYMVWLGERVAADIRQKLFSHLVNLAPSFYANERTGEIISRFTSDTTLLQSVIGTGISMTLRSSVMFIGALILMAFTSLKLTVFVFIAIPFILIPVKLIGPKVRLYSKESQDKVADIGSLVDESLHEIKVVQAYTSETTSIGKFAKTTEEVLATAKKRIHYRALMIAVVMLISMLAMTAIAYLGFTSVQQATITSGQLVAFMFYAVIAGGSIATISEVIGELQKAAGASERIIQLLNTQTFTGLSTAIPSKSRDIQNNVAVKNTDINSVVLSLNSVVFSYDTQPVINNVSFTVEHGQKIAIVGPSGAGKSTLFDLILGFHSIDSGSIKVYGKSLKELDAEQLRRQFALVPQDPVIFAGTVFDNITYGAIGNVTPSRKEAIKAAELANAAEFINELPDSYDSQLGERGVKLSGGQKQRIAIARAIASARPILLLDEATSALDAKSEKQIKLALDTLMQNKTTLIIAHRLSTVVNADKIIVLDKGRVITQGPHRELYQSSEIYKEFVDLQLIDE